MASPSSSSKPNKPKKMYTFVGLNSEFPRNEELPIRRNYSSNSNSPLTYNTARVAAPRPVRIEGTNELHGRIRNKKKTRGKRRKSGKKTKRKKRSN